MVQTNTSGPFTEEDLTELNGRLEDVKAAEVLLDQSTRAGIDMSAQITRVKELKDQLLKIKQSFWPGR